MRTGTKLLHPAGQRGVALVITLLTLLVVSGIALALTAAATTDVQITTNEVTTSQSFYVAEAGLNEAAAWFSARFTNSPNDAGLFLMPEQNTSTSPNSTKLSYTVPPDPPIFLPGYSANSYPEAKIPTSVKIGFNGRFENVAITGSTLTTTFPNSYSVTANDQSGTPKTFNYTNVVTEYRANLVNRPVGDGQFTVKAILLNFRPPADDDNGAGTMTWQLESTGTVGNAKATLIARLTAPLYKVERTETEEEEDTEDVAVPGGVVARGKITLLGNSVIDSYRSSLGTYGAGLTTGTYAGQRGAQNKGSLGQLHSNGEGTQGFITGNGSTSIYGNAHEKLPASDNPIQVVSITGSKHYSQPNITFPDVPNVPGPKAGAPNYDTNKSATLPPGDYNHISAGGNATLTVRPSSYGNLTVDGGASVVLGLPNQLTVYNFQNITVAGGATIVIQGPIIINVKNNFINTGGSSVATALRPGDVQVNVKGGSDSKLEVTGNSMKFGVFYAPNSEVVIAGTGDMYGSVVGRNVTVNGNASIHVDENTLSGVLSSITTVTTTTNVKAIGYSGGSFVLQSVKQALN